MTGFSDPISGGGILVQPEIRSPNFVTGASGWIVRIDGSAEFSDLVVRGTFDGNDFVINDAGEFFYSGTPALGNLVASIASAPGTDAEGNAYQAPGFFGYANDGVSHFYDAQFAAAMVAGDGVAAMQLNHAAAAGAVKLTTGGIYLMSSAGANAQALITNSSLLSLLTGALLEVQGSLAVTGSAPGQLAFVKQTGTAGHAMTVFLSASGGASQAALNVVSANSAFTCLEVSGTEKTRGTVKITHQGYADGSDSGAAAISIDLQTTAGGTSGTAAGGIFITSTTDNPYATGVNLLNIRVDNAETVVKTTSDGPKMGISVPVSHVPSAMLEIDLIGSETHHLDLRDNAGAHCNLYTLNGALVYKGGAGTVTTLAPA